MVASSAARYSSAGVPALLSAIPGLLIVADSALAESAAVATEVPNALSVVQGYPLLSGAAALLAVGGVALASASRPVRFQATGAKEAYEALGAEERAVLVDIRHKALQKEGGVVDLKGTSKKPISIVYAEPDDDGDLAVDSEFASQLQQAPGISPDSILILLDADGSLAAKAAAEAARDGFFREKVYWVRGGLEGPKGWKAAGLPTKPYRTFELPLPSLALELPSLDLDLTALASGLRAQLAEQAPGGVDLGASVDKLSGAVTTITDKYKENPSVGNGILAAAGVAVVGAFAITELESILQVVGALGLARFLASNLLFAKDREATLASARAFLKERGFEVPTSGSGTGSGGGGGGGGLQGDLRRLADIVMGARDAESAAEQITQQMLPDVKGADPEALAAALAAAGFDLSLPALEAASPAPQDTPQEPLPALASAAGPEPSAEPVAAPAAEQVAGHVAVGVPLAGAAVEASSDPAPVAAGAAVATAAADAAEAVEMPANVLEARAWITAWKEGRGAALAEAAKVGRAGSVAEAQTMPAGGAAADNGAAAASPAPAVAEVGAEVMAEVTPVAATTASASALEAIAVEPPASVPNSGAEASRDTAGAVPANVVAAREWIAAWRASRQAAAPTAMEEQSVATQDADAVHAPVAASPASPEEVVVSPAAMEEAATAGPNVLEARQWIAAWKEGQARLTPIGGDGASDSDPAEAPEAAAPEVVQEAALVNVAA